MVLYFCQGKKGFKGSVQPELRPMLLYIIRKLFSRRYVADDKILKLLKGLFTIYKKPLQRTLPRLVTFACKSNKLLQILSANSNYRRNLRQRRVTLRGRTCTGPLLFAANLFLNFHFCQCQLLSADEPSAESNDHLQGPHRRVTIR
jgi:hypothetical protein